MGLLSCTSQTVPSQRPPSSAAEPTGIQDDFGVPQLKLRAVACELVDSNAVRLLVVIENVNAVAVGLVVPPRALAAEPAPEFPEFQGALDTPVGLETRCGPAASTRITLEPGQRVTRSLVFPIARWEKDAATESTVGWRWRQFDVERPYEETQALGCSVVRLAVEDGRCELKSERAVHCPPEGQIDGDLERSDAQPPHE